MAGLLLMLFAARSSQVFVSSVHHAITNLPIAT